MTPDPHKPLRDDVRLLGELLGDTLKADAGEDVLRTVERVRGLSKSARAGSTEAFAALADVLARMSLDEALPVARAFAQFLHLANIAEQHHRVRRRRAYQRDPAAPPQRGSCEDSFGRLLSAGITPDRLHESVCALQIELVLTAHPTEVARRRIVQKHNRIARALAERDRPDLTTIERDELVASLRREIESAWGTSEVREQRPSPIDEVRSGLIVFEQSLWDAVPRFARTMDRALRASTGRGLPVDATPIRFGSWIGGDRDGNPHVTPQVTRRACWLSRWAAADLYLDEIDALRDELSLDDATPELLERAGSAREPYRELLRKVRGRMRATRDWIETTLQGDEDAPVAPDVYLDSAELMADLRLCHRSLEATGHAPIAAGRLTDLLRRVSVFDLTLARIDIRQDSARHVEALSAITAALGLGCYGEWDEATRVEFLLRELEGRRPLIPANLDATPAVRDVLDTFAMIARMPAGSLNAYIITMTRAASDVLAVELLQKEGRRVASTAANGAAVRDRTRSAGRRRRARLVARSTVVSRADRRPPGSDAGLFGLGEGRRAADGWLGALQGAGSDRRVVPSPRRARHALSRPRWQCRSRRRSHAPGAEIAAARVDGRHTSRHRAGRDAAGALWIPRHRAQDDGGLHDGDTRSMAGAGGCAVG